MTTYFKTIMRAITNVIDWCTGTTANQTITDSVPAFGDAVDTLIAKRDAINLLIQEQVKVLNGYYSHKLELKTTAANSGMDVIAPAMSYFMATGNQPMLDAVRSTFSDLMKTDDGEFVPRIKGVSDIVTPILTSLIPYGLSQTKIDTMNTTAVAFRNYASTPRNQIIQRANATTQIEEQVKSANDFLRTTLNPLSRNFKAPQYDFWLGYNSAKKHTPFGGQHTRLDALTTDELGQPFYNVTVTVNELVKDGKTFASASDLSDIDGLCEVSSFEAGIRSVTLSGKTIKTRTVEGVLFERGKATRMTFICTPIFENIPAERTEMPSTAKSGTTTKIDN